MALKRRALSTPASIAGVGNAAPKAVIVGRVAEMQACPRRRASLATNDRRGGQAVFAEARVAMLGLREAVIAFTCFLRIDSPLSAIVCAACTMRSRIASASVGSSSHACQAVDRQLAGDQRRARADAVVEQLEQVVALGRRRSARSRSRRCASRSMRASCASRRAKLPSPCATCSSSSSRGARMYSTVKPERAACCASAQASHVLPTPVAPVISTLCAVAQPVAAGQRGDEAAVQAARGAPVDVLDAGAADLELGRLEQPRQALVVAPVDLALHQQRQPLVEGQLGRGGAGGLVGQRVHHAVQAQAAQLVQGVFVEQGGFSFVGGQW